MSKESWILFGEEENENIFMEMGSRYGVTLLLAAGNVWAAADVGQIGTI